MDTMQTMIFELWLVSMLDKLERGELEALKTELREAIRKLEMQRATSTA